MVFKRSLWVFVWVFTNFYAGVVEINDLNKFNEKIKTGVSVVKFYMDNCPPCRASTPMFNNLSQNNNYKDINFIMVNFNRGKVIAMKYARMFPTFAFFKDGSLSGDKIVGYDNATRNQIASRLDSLIVK